jgi:cobalt-precorrin-5B (C1)-methyltransferase
LKIVLKEVAVEEYQFSQGKNLRCGYTTGSCATAAAKAAATMLLSGEPVASVRIDTPKGIVLDLEPLEVERREDYVSCAIRKDSGDDPDDTNGVLVFARVEKATAEGVLIEGGIGVGRVTKPGLACAQGGPAINPTPRRMITEELTKVMHEQEWRVLRNPLIRAWALSAVFRCWELAESSSR